MGTFIQTARTRDNDRYFTVTQEALALDCGRLCDLPSKWKEWQVTEGQKDGAELLGWEHTELGQTGELPLPPVGIWEGEVFELPSGTKGSRSKKGWESWWLNILLLPDLFLKLSLEV